MNKLQSEKIANKLTNVFDLVAASFNQEDIKNLKEFKQTIKEEISQLGAVAGLLVPLEKANAKEKLGEQAIKRLNAIITLWEEAEKVPKINMEYAKEKAQKKIVEGMFGL